MWAFAAAGAAPKIAPDADMASETATAPGVPQARQERREAARKKKKVGRGDLPVRRIRPQLHGRLSSVGKDFSQSVLSKGG